MPIDFSVSDSLAPKGNFTPKSHPTDHQHPQHVSCVDRQAADTVGSKGTFGAFLCLQNSQSIPMPHALET